MDKITTPEFRVSFPSVFEPKSFENQPPKYSICMLFDKSTDISKLKELAKAAAIQKWGADQSKWPKNLRTPFRDGDKEKPDSEEYNNVTFVNASSKMKPGVVDAQRNLITSKEEFYGGCYARAVLTCYAYEKMGNKGIAFGLQNLQKLRDGTPFSGRNSAENDFDEVKAATIEEGTEQDFL